ncbi:MAG: hypothetical protein ACTSR9_19355 [Candidatus Thorarchaeota archaeon]
MVFAKNTVVDPSVSALKSGKVTRPQKITISTEVSGLFGPMTNTTTWLTQYDHEEYLFREDIVFKEGWLITGKKKERVLPWHLAKSHIRTITQVGGILFKRKKYTGHRLYGSRTSHGSSVFEVTAKDSKDKVHTAILGAERDAVLWRTLTRIMQQVDLDLPEIKEMKAKEAKQEHHPELSMAKVIDLARENSLRLKYNLFRIIEDISRADRYRQHFESLEGVDFERVKEWTEIVWETFVDGDCPRIWE